MRVVDTSAWIEWFIGGPLHKKLIREFPEKALCVVPTIVQLELSKWLVREVGEDRADQAIAYTQKCVVAPLDTRIAISAAELHRQYKLATADAIVYATAINHGADLLTCDAHFEKLPGVVLIRKGS
ncbi:MAG: type II toxin-antitoxin system VapC family toxin [Usitatibacter sp.]